VTTPLSPEVAAYIASSYPHNHDYRVVRGKLKPRWKLWRRLGRLQRLYPEPLRELLDLSSCKGFFVLDAAQRPTCERALGIDIHAPDLDASRAVAGHLGLRGARFEELTLSDLAERIGEFGGPFQTTLLVNTYPYLFFGSDRSDEHVPDHDELFRRMASVTSERLIFSNRIEFDVLPRHIQRRAAELGLEGGYDGRAIRAAAEKHFELKMQRPLGRIPLWLLRPRH